MTNSPRVLVIDGQPETEEVLKAVLEPRGYQIDLQSRMTSEKDVNLQQKPHLVVLHEEPSTISCKRQQHSFQDVPRVIIGSISNSNYSDQSAEQRLSQPFQYSELIQAIERLLKK